MQRRGGVATTEQGKKRQPVYNEIQRQKKTMDSDTVGDVHSQRQASASSSLPYPYDHNGSCVFIACSWGPSSHCARPRPHRYPATLARRACSARVVDV